MKLFKADIHTHTVLSPCGDLGMSPQNIISKAHEKGIQILGITDHNSTRQCETMKKIASRKDIYLLCGAEVTTKEEVHCLVYFDKPAQLKEFDTFIYSHLAEIKNNPEKFGYQAVVDENDMILEQPEKLLISATNIGITQLSEYVHKQNGIFIPAHIDRMSYGILAQLGFLPPDLKLDALELSKHTPVDEFVEKHPEYSGYSFIQSSDAHFIEDIGAATANLMMDHLSFSEIKMALNNKHGRKIIVK